MSTLSDYMKSKKSISDVLLVSDIDGTLMNRDSLVSDENKTAVQEFIDMGGKFSVCTGRVIGSSEWIHLPVNMPSILHNGGSIYDYEKKEILWTVPMPDTVKDLIHELLLQFPQMAWTVYTPKEQIYLHHNSWAEWLTSIEGCDPDAIGENLEDIKDPIIKFVVPAAPEEIEEARSYLDEKFTQEPNPGVLYDVSLPTLFEFTSTTSDKGSALKELSRMTGYALEDIIYMGDNMNDMTALQSAGFAIVPASGHEEAKKVADYITLDQDENIMIDVLNEIKRGLG